MLALGLHKEDIGVLFDLLSSQGKEGMCQRKECLYDVIRPCNRVAGIITVVGGTIYASVRLILLALAFCALRYVPKGYILRAGRNSSLISPNFSKTIRIDSICSTFLSKARYVKKKLGMGCLIQLERAAHSTPTWKVALVSVIPRALEIEIVISG